ncbi:MAG: fasciclin domain-containing protein [Alphaproteobacteria bacterium]|nr:fasciclin domain-containing protein [Alphaproteobacteria bacterium]
MTATEIARPGGATVAAASGSRQPRVLMITIVWGEWYLNAHLALNLPSLLAAGNLPAFCAAVDLTYVIMTRQVEVESVRRAPSVQALSRLMPVEIRVIAESETADPIGAHQRAWARATAEAKAMGRFVLYMPPDVAWSDGSFRHLAKLLADGYAAVFMTYLRVVSETFVPAAQQRLDPASQTLAIGGRDLVKLSLEHVHPLMAAHMYDSPYFPVHPEMLVWPVAGEGVAVRCLAREMFLFDPNRIDMTDQLLVGSGLDAGTMRFVDDSDDLYAVSLAPLGKDVEWHLNPEPADLMAVARWWLTYDSPVNDLVAANCLRWHHGETTPARWRRVDRASALWVHRMMALREGLRIWRVLIDDRAWTAAALLALALRTGAFVSALAAGRGRSAVIFVPVDGALKHLEPGLSDAANGGRDLARLMRRHVVYDDAPMAALLEDGLAEKGSKSLRSAADEALPVSRDARGIAAGGHRLVGAGQRVGRHVVYLIDGVIGEATHPLPPEAGG